MNSKRAVEIVNNREIGDVYYKKHPVWIQEVKNDVAKVGFMDLREEQNVNVEDLYEQNF